MMKIDDVFLYDDIVNSENVISFKVKKDVPLSKLLLSFPYVDDESIVNGDLVVDDGTSIFIDKNNKAIAMRKLDKSMILLFDGKILTVNFSDSSYTYNDGTDVFESTYLAKEGKHMLFPVLTEFLRNFSEINGYLPIDSSLTFIFLNMGILNKDDSTIVIEANGILLYLNSFRSLNFSKLKLNIADSYTYEVVGSIDLNLNESSEDNFSYRGNVSYKISEEYQSKGYATDALKTLIEYLDTVEDDYNKELYVAALVDDIAYQMVAIKNGGVLVYDGEVPGGDSLSTINKIKEIKIYKIGNK